jgi:phage-related baseplate assembly protein
MAAMPATPSTSVDLSRLPAPTIVPQLGFEKILAELVASMQALLPSFDATIDSDPVVKILQVAAYREVLVRQEAQDGALQTLVAYATGATLDHLAARMGVTRLIIAPADLVTGAEPALESDDDLRQRIVLAPESYSVAGPELAYVYHAKTASPLAIDASAISPQPGEVLVSVLSGETPAGAASDALLASIRAIVTAPEIRPLGDAVTVASAEIVPYAIDATIFPFDGPDADLLIETGRVALAGYVADCHKLGRAVRRTSIAAALTVPGVENVVVNTPAADVVCERTQASHCTGIVLRRG